MTAFQVDRDRILHTNAFRRLKHKTQVFIAPLGDHYTTRMTHSLEVAHIARAVARALNLNEDLAEAISLGHDMGHPPFGHLGEEVLGHLYSGGFRHNRQSLRIVDVLENDGKGLNLTWEVRQGILRHSKSRKGIEGVASTGLDTLEGQICRIADAVAYTNHDVDDALRAGLLKLSDLPSSATSVLGRTHAARISQVMADIIETSWLATGEVPLDEGQVPTVKMSRRVSHAVNELREFLFERVYEPSGKVEQAQRAREMLELLYGYFSTHEEQIPEGSGIERDDPRLRAVDYIAGMTDSYALRVAEAIKPGITKGFLEEGVPLAVPEGKT